MRVLLVEDHRAMREITAAYLRDRGFAVDAVERGEEGLAAAAAAGYDAVILDLGLPDMDGMEVLRRLRNGKSRNAPTLILTARGRLDDRLGGLDAGADDYILKPFELSELEARLRAVLRRPGARSRPVHLYGDLRFDPGARSATVGDVELELTRREASVLEELMRAGGRVVVKDALEDRLYGFDDDVSANALEAAVSRLRRKLVAARSDVAIETMRGVGYRLRIETARPREGKR